MLARALLLLVLAPFSHGDHYFYDEGGYTDNVDFVDGYEDSGITMAELTTTAQDAHTRVRRYGALTDERRTLNPQEIQDVKDVLKDLFNMRNLPQAEVQNSSNRVVATWGPEYSSASPPLYEYFDKVTSKPTRSSADVKQDQETETARTESSDESPSPTSPDGRQYWMSEYTETATLFHNKSGVRYKTTGFTLDTGFVMREDDGDSSIDSSAWNVLRQSTAGATNATSNQTETTPPKPSTCPPIPTTTTTTTTPRPTLKLDIEGLMALIANLTYDYDMNLTERFNETLIKYSVPTCPTPTTTTPTTTTTTVYINPFINTTVMGKCFVCGLVDQEIPQNTICGDAFAGDFLPLVPQDHTARGHIARFRKYCRFLDVHNYMESPDEPRAIFGRFTGGCSVRWTDLSSIYTQRTCRNRRRAIMGKHFASKRMAKLEMALHNVENGCIVSPMASLLPMSRGISLYARFHACVCMGSWCNVAVPRKPWIPIFWLTIWLLKIL
ncbi:uncharacterized protein LOC142984414 [Anticarsia gemmatalis]|uniref:uncharacterized protein LOC142984414 n=1 Tax=Anticarsia gemmatalis TaxID=129554 RepID=UPI003F75C121